MQKAAAESEIRPLAESEGHGQNQVNSAPDDRREECRVHINIDRQPNSGPNSTPNVTIHKDRHGRYGQIIACLGHVGVAAILVIVSVIAILAHVQTQRRFHQVPENGDTATVHGRAVTDVGPTAAQVNLS